MPETTGTKRQTKAQLLATMFQLVQQGKTQEEIIAAMATPTNETYSPEKLQEFIDTGVAQAAKENDDYIQSWQAYSDYLQAGKKLFDAMCDNFDTYTQKVYSTIPTPAHKKIRVNGRYSRDVMLASSKTIAFQVIKRAERVSRKQDGEKNYTGFMPVATLPELKNADKVLRHDKNTTRKISGEKFWRAFTDATQNVEQISLKSVLKIAFDTGVIGVERKTAKLAGSDAEWWGVYVRGVNVEIKK